MLYQRPHFLSIQVRRACCRARCWQIHLQTNPGLFHILIAQPLLPLGLCKDIISDPGSLVAFEERRSHSSIKHCTSAKIQCQRGEPNAYLDPPITATRNSQLEAMPHLTPPAVYVATRPGLCSSLLYPTNSVINWASLNKCFLDWKYVNVNLHLALNLTLCWNVMSVTAQR